MIQKNLMIKICWILYIVICCSKCLWIQKLDDSDEYYRITFEDEMLEGESLVHSRGRRSLYRGYQGMEPSGDTTLDFYEFGDELFIADYDYDF